MQTIPYFEVVLVGYDMHITCIKIMVTSIRIELRTVLTGRASSVVLIALLAKLKVVQIMKLKYL